MNAFRTLLVIIFTVIFGYTMIVGFNHGWNLLPLFFGDIATMNWAGQFILILPVFLFSRHCGYHGVIIFQLLV